MNKYPANKILIFVFSIFLFLSACTGAPSIKKAPIRIGYRQWYGDYTLPIGKQKGFFDKYGVDVQPIYYDVNQRLLSDLASSQIDGAVLTIGDALLVDSHTELSTIAVSDDGGISVIASTSDIRTTADLRGKTVGVKLASTDELTLVDMLAAANLRLNDMNIINILPEDIPDALSKGTIQAGLTRRPFSSRSISLGFTILISSKDVSSTHPNIIVFRSDFASSRSEEVKSFLKGWFDTVDFRQKNSQEANHLIAFILNIPVASVTSDAKLLTLADNVGIFSANRANQSRSIFTTAELIADLLMKSGSITRIPNIQSLFDSSYLAK